jgi:hypothetical protein
LEAFVGSTGELGHLADPIQHGPANAVIGERLEPDPSAWVEAVPGLQKAPEPKGDEVVEIAAKGELSAKPVREAMDHFLVPRDELRALHADS